MTVTQYFPIRLALSFDKHEIHVVRIIDEISTEYISVPHYNFESFLRRCLQSNPLFILEDRLDPTNASYREDRASLVNELVDEYLTIQQANVIKVRVDRLPATFVAEFKRREIQPAYYKSLWLCRYYKSKESK